MDVANIVLKDLVVRRESKLFVVMAIISTVAWAGLVVGLIVSGLWGILLGIATIPLVLYFVTGMLAARLKTEAVEIHQMQMPELSRDLAEGCERLQLRLAPRLFVMQSGGALNAFAMRHARRDFVVLYSELVETFPAGSPELKFIVGHELGHIQRKHILKSIFLLPSMFLPLLGRAYLRACESTCDRFGEFVAQNADGSIRAILALAGGKHLCQDLDATQFARQQEKNRGFFVSLHELLSTYPTLSRRISELITFQHQSESVKLKRNPLAWIFACFVPSTGFLATLAIIYLFVIILVAKNAKDLIEKKADEQAIEMPYYQYDTEDGEE